MPGSAGELARGWRPGLIGQVAAAHGVYYARHWGFGAALEALIARDQGDFYPRYDPASDLTLSAWEGEHLLGAVTRDGADPVLPAGVAHLRWFIVAEPGRGLGARLLRGALAFSDGRGFRLCHLSTFRGLEAARVLYERAGFRLVREAEGTTWGRPVTEQAWERPLGG